MSNLVQAYHDYLSGKSLEDLSLILSAKEFNQLKQMINNNDYWGDRLATTTHKALNKGMTKSQQVFNLYDDLANKLSTELLQLYSKIDVQKALGEVQISDFYRSGQLQNILDTIRKECQKIGRYENKNLNQLLPDAVNKGYEIAGDVFDIKLGHLNKKAVQAIVNDPWTDKSFSDRVWQNKVNLIDRLNKDLTTGLATGKSPYKIASKLSESLNVSKHASQRLVITEYMNKLNMGQQKAYEESGYKEVRWHAVEDERKCSICGKLHDTKFKIDEAPHAPIHPRCRCILLPVIDEVEEDEDINEGEIDDILNSLDKQETKTDEELIDDLLGEMNRKTPEEELDEVFREFNKNDTIEERYETNTHIFKTKEDAEAYDKILKMKRLGDRINAYCGQFGLTLDEWDGVATYMGNGVYAQLNAELRNHGGVPQSDYTRKLVENINGALDKYPKFNGKNDYLVRDTDISTNVIKDRYQEGKRVVEPAFTSTTTTKEGVGPFKNSKVRFKIYNSYSGAELMPVNPFGEHEVLFKPNTEFEVLSVYKENGKIIIEMSEL